jgi:hypothetical protein
VSPPSLKLASPEQERVKVVFTVSKRTPEAQEEPSNEDRPRKSEN